MKTRALLNKSQVTSIIISMLLLTFSSTFAHRAAGFSQTVPTIYIDPRVTSAAPNDFIVVTVNVFNVTDLSAWGGRLSWDPTVLEAFDAAEGDFLLAGAPEGTFYVANINNTGGYIDFGDAIVGEYPGVDGNGTLAVVTFLVEAYGPGIINLELTQLLDHYLHPMSHESADGFLFPPVAAFTFTPSAPLLNQIITFNASDSYDPNGDIASYTWDFGDGNITVVSNPVIQHSFDTAANYEVNLTVTDSDGLTHSVDHFVPISALLVQPSSGPVGTKVLLEGTGIPPNSNGTLYFDDQFITADLLTDDDGSFNATFNVPLSAPGPHDVKVFFAALGEFKKTTFTVTDTTPLEVAVDVGTIHFRGELAEFYAQVSFKGVAVNATTITAKLYKPGGATESLTIQLIATGLYKFPYTLPTDSATGTYLLVVEAWYFKDTTYSRGTSFKTFLLSPTFTDWNAKIINIDENITLVKTDIGTIKVDTDMLEANVTLISGNIATVLTTVAEIKGDVVSVKGNLATVKTDVGTIKATLQGWMGGTASLVTPQGTFKSLVLTTSTLETITVSDYTISVTVSGEKDSEGTMNVLIPKELLTSIPSSTDKIAVTVDGATVSRTLVPLGTLYLLHMTYSHSTRAIKIYLTGIPPTFPWTLVIALIIAIIAVGVAIFLFKTRRKRLQTTENTKTKPESTAELPTS